MTLIKGETVTVFARVEGALDRYNKPTYTWPTGVDVDGVLVAPGKSVEGNEAIRREVDTACTLYRIPNGTAVGPHDQVEVRGRRWAVDGDTAWWSNGEWAPGGVLELKVTDG